MKTELQFLGCGGAFTMSNRHSNMVLKHEGRNLLIDCGSDIRHSLQQCEMSHLDIDAVYVSHLHGDHAGGLEWLAFISYFDPAYKGKPELITSRSLVNPLWSNTLSGGLASVQGKIMEMKDYYEVKAVGRKGLFKWNGIEFQLVQTVHIMDGFSIVPSFGLMFEMNGKQMFITTDTQYCPEQIKDFYEMADVVFHDAETAPYMSRVHAHYSQLRHLPDKVREKMWLYHYQDGKLPDAEKDGFSGFVKKGQIFT